MAYDTLDNNINKVITDLNNIRSAIANKGVEIPISTPTSEYPGKISSIPTTAPPDYISNIEVNRFYCGQNIDQYEKTAMYAGGQQDVIDFYPFGTRGSCNISDNGEVLVLLVSDLYPFVFIYERDIDGRYKLNNQNAFVRDACASAMISPDGKTILLFSTDTTSYPTYKVICKDENNQWYNSDSPLDAYINYFGIGTNPTKTNYFYTGIGNWSVDSQYFCCTYYVSSSVRGVIVFKRKAGSYDVEPVANISGTASFYGIALPSDVVFNYAANKIYVYQVSSSKSITCLDFDKATNTLSMDPLFVSPDTLGLTGLGSRWLVPNEQRNIWAMAVSLTPFVIFFKLDDATNTFTKINQGVYATPGTAYCMGWGRGLDKDIFIRITATTPFNHAIEFSDPDNPTIVTNAIWSGATALSAALAGDTSSYNILYDSIGRRFLRTQLVTGYIPIQSYDPATKTLYHKAVDRNFVTSELVGKPGVAPYADYTDDKTYQVLAFTGTTGYTRWGYVLLKRQSDGTYLETNFFDTNITATFTPIKIQILGDIVFCSVSTTQSATQRSNIIFKIDRTTDTFIKMVPDVEIPTISQPMVAFGDNNEYVYCPVASTTVGMRWYKIDTINNVIIDKGVIPATLPATGVGYDNSGKFGNNWYISRTITNAGYINPWLLFKFDSITETFTNIVVSPIVNLLLSDSLYGSLFYGDTVLKVLIFKNQYPYMIRGIWNNVTEDMDWYEEQFNLFSVVSHTFDWMNRKIYAYSTALYPANRVTWVFDNDTGKLRYYRTARHDSSAYRVICHKDSDFMVWQGTVSKIESYYGVIFKAPDLARTYEKTQSQIFGQALESGQSRDLIYGKSLFF